MSSPSELDELVWKLRQSCRLNGVLDVGCGSGDLVRRMLEHGIDARGVDPDPTAIAHGNTLAPGRFMVGHATTLPVPERCVDSVVSVGLLDRADGMQVDAIVREMRRVVRSHVVVRVRLDPSDPTRDRGWWERQFFVGGFRRHPLFVRVLGYETLGDDTGFATLMFERISDAAMAAYPLEVLAIERDLHTDMLREAGRRSDAHVMRYQFAASLTRPGDAVLDVACGLGYGAAVIAASGKPSRVTGMDASSFAVDYASRCYGDLAAPVQFLKGDAHRLERIDSGSVGLVASFETIEHLERPADFITEVHRVLTPGGRLVCSIPNRWVDEEGNDPNPHHLHVFDAERLQELCGKKLLVEQMWAQVAGGAVVLRDSPKSWRRVDPAAARETEAEWWILVAMRDPREGAGLKYEESVFWQPSRHPAPAVVRFDDYDNPWIVHALVTMGMRLEDEGLRDVLMRDILDRAPNGGSDAGAALCGIGYGLLSRHDSSAAEIDTWVARACRWLEAAPETGHCLRWRVSLRFVTGRLLLKCGRREEAAQHFEVCAGETFGRFSPLLGSRVIESAYLAGCLRAFDGEGERAMQLWEAGIAAARAACTSDWHEIAGWPGQRLWFGPSELTRVLDQASRCAAALAERGHFSKAPARFVELIYGLVPGDRQAMDEAWRRWHEAHGAFKRTPILSPEKIEGLAAQLRYLVVQVAEGRPLYLWGAGGLGQIVAALCSRAGIVPSGFVDRDPEKVGRSVAGHAVISPQDFERLLDRRPFVVISSMFTSEIAVTLSRMGLRPGSDFVSPPDHA